MVSQGRPDVVGVDGCKAGWFAVRLPGQGEHKVARFCTFGELLNCHATADLILVDIPIGLPEDANPRECDLEARMRLGSPRASSIFPTPTRQATEQASKAPKDFNEFCRVQKEITGKKLPKQSFAITPKIAEVDAIVRERKRTNGPAIREIHPEVCFWALNGERPTIFSKKQSGKVGFCERIRILKQIEPRTDDIIADARDQFLRRDVGWDDIADALAAAVTAYHGYDSLRTLPASPPYDAKGLPMEMVYWVPPAP